MLLGAGSGSPAQFSLAQLHSTASCFMEKRRGTSEKQKEKWKRSNSESIIFYNWEYTRFHGSSQASQNSNGEGKEEKTNLFALIP